LVLSRSAIRITWDQHVDDEHLRDIALHVWGEDSRAMMREFQPTSGLLTQYQNSIVDCDRALRGKRVLDMGCNNGLYSYLAMRHGASHVLGVEPRGMFVDGLNAFAQQHEMPLEFRRGYDTDLPRLTREHDTDTVLMLGMDELVGWEDCMRSIRNSGVEWVIMRMTSIPDAWMGMNGDVFDFASAGAGMPVGFTLHYQAHNSDTRSGINPVNRDRADPSTGYQHIDRDGQLDTQSSVVMHSRRSSNYIRWFIDNVGFTVESSRSQDAPMPESPSLPASFGLHQWYLLRNRK
jgi:SAM-dependent methyltransferase